MSRRDPRLAFRHMLDHAREATALVANRSRGDLDRDRLLNLALVRLLEVLGEAATRVPAMDQATHATIPWAPIVGLRNRLIHGYDAVDFDIVWSVVTTDLPPLIAALEAILAGET